MKKCWICLFSLLFCLNLFPQEDIRIACIGNSITNGGNSSNSYPQQLDAMLGPGYDVRNFGISGTTMLKKGDLPYWNQTAFETAKEFLPDIVIILLGTNDSKPQNWIYGTEYYSDYIDMIREFRKEGRNPDIFVGHPCPAFSNLAGINDSIIHNEIIPLVDSVKRTARTFLVNFYDTMINYKELFPDGIHPNSQGYKLMAEIAADAILNRPSGVVTKFRAIPDYIEEDAEATLYWETSSGSVVTLNGENVAEDDSMIVNPIDTTEYTLIASGEFGDTAKVIINFLPSGIIKSFKAVPSILEMSTGESSVLTWETTNNSHVFLNGIQTSQNNTLIVNPSVTTDYTLIASGAIKDTSTISVQVLSPDIINRSLLADSIKSSSTEFMYSPQWACDGDTSTGWMSNGSGTEWIGIYFHNSFLLKRIKLIWGGTYAATFSIWTLFENKTSTVFNTTTGTGGVYDIKDLYAPIEYMRVLCVKPNLPGTQYVIKELEVYGSTTGSSTESENYKELVFNLEKNYPNPFNPVTTIKYSIGDNSLVNISIYNLLGQKIDQLVNENQKAGEHSVIWNAGKYTSGFYLYQMTAGDKKFTGKCLLLK